MRWDVKVKSGAVFRFGTRLFECVHNKKDARYDIELVDEFDQQKRIRFENVEIKPPLKSGDIIMYGDDNWFCCYGADLVVAMLKYDAIYEQKKNKNKGFQFLIQADQ